MFILKIENSIGKKEKKIVVKVQSNGYLSNNRQIIRVLFKMLVFRRRRN